LGDAAGDYGGGRAGDMEDKVLHVLWLVEGEIAGCSGYTQWENGQGAGLPFGVMCELGWSPRGHRCQRNIRRVVVFVVCIPVGDGKKG
jgi:hypothetical protein